MRINHIIRTAVNSHPVHYYNISSMFHLQQPIIQYIQISAHCCRPHQLSWAHSMIPQPSTGSPYIKTSPPPSLQCHLFAHRPSLLACSPSTTFSPPKSTVSPPSRAKHWTWGARSAPTSSWPTRPCLNHLQTLKTQILRLALNGSLFNKWCKLSDGVLLFHSLFYRYSTKKW